MKEKFKDLCAMTPEQISQEIREGAKTLMQFRFQGVNPDMNIKPHVVKMVRRRIARLKTVQSRQKLEQQGGQS